MGSQMRAWPVLVGIVEKEGLFSLWRGLGASLAMSVPNTAVYLALYDLLKGVLNTRPDQAPYDGSIEATHAGSAWAPAVAGPVARVAATVATAPMEYARVNAQAGLGQRSSVIEMIRDSVRRAGVLSLWTGLGPTLLRDVPFSAIYWVLYEYLTASAPASSSSSSFVAGCAAGATAAFLTTPIDVIKTKIQTSQTLHDPACSEGKPGAFRMFQNVLKTEGVRGLFRGVGPRVLRVAPASAIVITTYKAAGNFFAKIDKN